MDLNPVDIFGGAVIGTTVSALYAGVEDLIAKNRMFRKLFIDIKSKLDTLKPLITQMVQSNQNLSYTQKNEFRGLEEVLKVGEELVKKCSNVSRWNPYRKYKYATKLLVWQEHLQRQLPLLQVQGIRDVKKTAVVVESMEVSVGSINEGVNKISSTLDEVNQLMIEEFMKQDNSAESRAWCAVPEPPEVIVGQEVPLEKLKSKLLGDDGVSMLVLTAPGGCGKTTLATNFCRDQDVRDKFGGNIFFVTISKKYSLNVIVEQLYRHKGSQVPAIQNEANAIQWLQTFLKKEGRKPLLLILDDVWSGSESLVEKFECRQPNIKILVTSRSEFRAFSPPYHLEMLGFDHAMKIFDHSASLGDKSSHIPQSLSRKIVERCKGFPLALTVVGRSLRAQPIEMWQNRLTQWSKGSSILDSETELLISLQSSLDALDKEMRIIKECFLDLGSFPEHNEIPVTALIDIWSESYDIEEDTSCIASLYELNNRSLAKLVDDRPSKLDGEGYYDEHYVTQHDLLRELAIYHSKLDSVVHRERLIIDICGGNLPKWWREQKTQVFKARLLSISTDEGSSTRKWPSIDLPETEVLVLNLRVMKRYAMPDFVEKMEKLKVLVITSELGDCFLDNLTLLSRSSNLKRIRLKGISDSSILESSIELKSVRKLSLIACDIKDKPVLVQTPFLVFPNLEEVYIERFTNTLLRALMTISLKKLTMNRATLEAFPDEIGNLVNLEELRLRLIYDLQTLPDSIKNLKKLNFLGIFDCIYVEKLPECIGEMMSLRKIDLRYCPQLRVIPISVLDLKQLEEVICDTWTEESWKNLLPCFRDRNQDIRMVVAPL